eukprot:321969-Chlamydomonas_euryale.AAC.1
MQGAAGNDAWPAGMQLNVLQMQTSQARLSGRLPDFTHLDRALYTAGVSAGAAYLQQFTNLQAFFPAIKFSDDSMAASMPLAAAAAHSLVTLSMLMSALTTQ